MHNVIVRQTGYICKDGGDTIVRNPEEALFRLDPTSLDVFFWTDRKEDRWKKVVPGTDKLVIVQGYVTGIYDSEGNTHKSWKYYVDQEMRFCITEFEVPTLEQRSRDFAALLSDKVSPVEVRYPRSTVLEIDGKEYRFIQIYEDLPGMKFLMDQIRTDTLLEGITDD